MLRPRRVSSAPSPSQQLAADAAAETPVDWSISSSTEAKPRILVE
ncbi:hypothetical protein ACP4OV_019680 [Aristida adscensionis]